MTANNIAGMGFVFGLMIAAVICVILFKFANSNRKIKTDYDERQEAIRNRGYKYAFYTIVALEAVMVILSFSEVAFPIDTYLIHLGIILVGCMVLCIHHIWNDVYWGLNNNHKRYNAIIVVAIVLNVLPIIMALSSGNIGTEGISSIPVMNIMVVVWMAIIGIASVIHKLVAKNEDEEA